MTNPTTTESERINQLWSDNLTIHPEILDEVADIKLSHYRDTKGGVLHINADRTVSNIFGCPLSDVKALCEISDLAANVHLELEREDVIAALGDLDINPLTFIVDFVEWDERA